MFCTRCGASTPEGAAFCGTCGGALPAGAPAALPPTAAFHAAAQLPSGNPPEMLDHLPGWNWGALLLTPFWALAHRLYFWAVLSFFFTCPLCFVLAAIGNREAWKARPFRDLDEFNAVQKAWTNWGVIVHIVSLLIVLGFVIWLAWMLNGLMSPTGQVRMW